MILLDGPVQVIRTAVGLPGRVVHLVERAEHLLDSTEATVARTNRVLGGSEAAVARTHVILGGADELTGDARGLLAQIEPGLQKVLPLLETFAERLSPAEVEAAIRLVDELPALTTSLREDVMPILGTLDRVGPDLNELLHVMDDVRQAILGVPGFAFFKRRGEERIEEDDDLDPRPHDEGLARSR